MALSHLRIFDKRGNNITPVMENGVMKFNIFFDPVSVGLFESEHIFIFEEVFKEFETSDSRSVNASSVYKSDYVPLNIRVLRYIRDWKAPVKKEQLGQLFPRLQIDIDYIDNFALKNERYINRIFDNDTTYYAITPDGLNYLKQYEEQETEAKLSAERLTKKYVRPRANFNPNDDNEETYLFFKWKNKDVNDDDIFMYFIDNRGVTGFTNSEKKLCLDDNRTYPTIVPVKSTDLEPDGSNPNWKKWLDPYQFENGQGDDYVDNDNSKRRIIDSTRDANASPFQINFAANSQNEDVVNRTLEIFAVRKTWNEEENDYVSNSYKVIEINLTAKFVEEEERFKNLLENFGRTIEESEAYIFRDAETEEDLPDYITLNEKRKELLLNGEEIYPYIGSYKAFTNALKFFGYQDLRLKEYFVNTKLSSPERGITYSTAVEIPLDLKIDNDYFKNGSKSYNELNYGDLIDSETYHKTSRFGLYYDLNKVTDEYDSNGFPIVVDAFQFTNEEILIKLYGLKGAMEKYFLPHHARIVDITGEGIYFAKYKINAWQNQTPIIPLRFEKNPSIKSYPEKACLQPLSKLLNYLEYSVPGFQRREFEEFDYSKPIREYRNRNLSEFLERGYRGIDYSFDGIEIDDILEHYETFEDVENAIREQMSSTCDGSEYNLDGKLWGVPVVVKLEPEIIRINELNFRFKYLKNNGVGKPWMKHQHFDINSDSYSAITTQYNEHKSEYENADQNDSNYLELENKFKESEKLFKWADNLWNEIDGVRNPDLVRFETEASGKDTNFRANNMGYYGSLYIEWKIEHEDGSYCYSDCGTIDDMKSYMFFLPKRGKYHVTCIVRDINNFPHITRVRDAIEVCQEVPEMLAIGRSIISDKINNLNIPASTAFGSFFMNGVNSLNTKASECNLPANLLYYQNYLNQCYDENIEKSEIIDIDESTNIIKLKGQDYYQNYLKYGNQKHRNVITLERNVNDYKEADGVEIKEVTNNTITLNGQFNNIDLNEKVNVYELVETPDYFITDNKVIISTDFIDYFSIGSIIYMVDGTSNIEYPYVVKDLTFDLIEGYVICEVDDDGSLNDRPYTKVIFRGDDYMFKVIKSVVNIDLNETKITINSSAQLLKELKSKTIENYRMDWGIFSGVYNFTIKDVTVDANDNTIVQVLDDNDTLCYTSVNFVATYTDYDHEYAFRYSNTKLYTANRFKETKASDIKNQTVKMLDFHGDSNLGFRITKVHDKGTIKFNNIEFEFDLSNRINDDRLYYLAELLNNSKLSIVNNFTYHVIENSYIEAVSKINSPESLIDIRYSYKCDGDKTSYPRANFLKWREDFYKGSNNLAMWNHLERAWVNNKERINYTNNLSPNKLDKRLRWATRGAFTPSNTFIKDKPFIIPNFTPVFFTVNNQRLVSKGSYRWELWRENDNKLMMKSNISHFSWNFTDIGDYSVKFIYTDENGQQITQNYASWVEVR